MSKTKLNLATLLVLFSSSYGLAQSYSSEEEENLGRSSAYMITVPPNENRFFRRIILGGGLINSGYEGADLSRYSRPNGYIAGILLDIIGTKKLVFEVGAQYRELVSNFEASAAPDSTVVAQYLTVPVNAKYYFNGQNATSLFIKGGVLGSTLLSNNKIYSDQNKEIGPRLWETALQAGMGVKLNLSPYSDLIIEANYNRSVDPIYENSSIFRSDLIANAAVALTL